MVTSLDLNQDKGASSSQASILSLCRLDPNGGRILSSIHEWEKLTGNEESLMGVMKMSKPNRSVSIVTIDRRLVLTRNICCILSHVMRCLPVLQYLPIMLVFRCSTPLIIWYAEVDKTFMHTNGPMFGVEIAQRHTVRQNSNEVNKALPVIK